MTVHDFQASLEQSHERADAPWWRNVYEQAFPTLQTMTCVRDDGWAQRGGIDRLLVLADGTTLTVDEKVRSTDYNDILLEYWSNYEQRHRGWVAKDLTCDFIAYAFVPSQRCYLLPFQLLRRAWRDHHREWTDRYERVEAKNRTYTTVSVAVPIPVVMDAIRDAMVVSWIEGVAA